jgi:hypothetical protein
LPVSIYRNEKQPPTTASSAFDERGPLKRQLGNIVRTVTIHRLGK